MSSRAPFLLPFAALLLGILPLGGCTLFAGAWDAIVGADEEPDEEAVAVQDSVLGYSLRDPEGAFDPSLVLAPSDHPLLAAEEVAPQPPEVGPAALRPAPAIEVDDTSEKVVRARNPPPPLVPQDEGGTGEAIDLALEIAVLALLAALFAGFIRAAVRHPGAVGLAVGLLALVIASIAYVRVS